MDNKEILEVTDYIYNNYPGFTKMFPRWRLLSLIDRHQDKIIYIKENGKFKGAALFLRLEDNSLNWIDMGVISLKGSEVVAELLKQNGDNIHFLGVVASSGIVVLRGLKNVIKKYNPKTVSWFKPEMDRVHFIKLRGELCHQS